MFLFELFSEKCDLSSAIGALGSKELKNHFCIKRDPMKRSAGALQGSANSAICRTNSTLTLIILRRTPPAEDLEANAPLP